MKKVIDIFKREGFSGVIKRTKIHLYRTFFLLIADFDTAIEKIEGEDSFKTIVIDESLSHRLIEDYPKEFTERKLRIFLEEIKKNNARGVAILKDDIIYAYLWSSIDCFEEGLTGYKRKLSNSEVYFYDLYTFKERRREGAGLAAFRHEMKYYKKQGYSKAITLVDDYNLPSLNVMRKMGFTKYGKLYHKTIAGKDYIKVIEK